MAPGCASGQSYCPASPSATEASSVPEVSSRQTSSRTPTSRGIPRNPLGRCRRHPRTENRATHDVSTWPPKLRGSTPPAEVIASLNRFAGTMPAAGCATVVCAVVDLAEQTITYSNAGHPPPLLVHDGHVVWLDQALDTPLAVNEPTRREARLDVRVDDLLVLYTDGLIERRDEGLDVGLVRLDTAAVAYRDEPVENVANWLIDELVGTTARDDVALVVKRIH